MQQLAKYRHKIVDTNQQKKESSQSSRLSFNSLSRNKDKNMIIMDSKKHALSPHRSTVLHTDKENNNFNGNCNHFNKQPSCEKVGLFTKIAIQSAAIGNKSPLKKRDGIFSQAINNAVNCQYYGTPITSILHESKPQRPQSRHKVQKYFPNSPSIIRQKTSPCHKIENSFQPTAHMLSSRNTNNTHTFPPNIYCEYYSKPIHNEDQIRLRKNGRSKQKERQKLRKEVNINESLLSEVNTSRTSIKFDMSPCFNY